ncbi:MAG: hypothetical protein FRX49_08584 [Trebouxia sp. A1-2]|nr:MAG: hypothetical protein FRX49_08584 [Trebouxia sp. A1-2]
MNYQCWINQEKLIKAVHSQAQIGGIVFCHPFGSLQANGGLTNEAAYARILLDDGDNGSRRSATQAE